ncbi:uncharacterized protein DUF3888 [Scopulibacillus darangshiensis]|uniref:Uncharacterized protein DUF3888 n=1 Tax=Scopulibacillus darangshiensis TaxID=442528 RepID=A0A4R2P663_9BACL|nr:DUF3888 domain-containing protein [Scopulibacillus darangshiensis]TCP30207.1 uncharacterized protein DUF3888 [Scopulibacillus darangshiensis]
MKKAYSALIAVLFLLTCTAGVQAKGNTERQLYATPKDILLDIIDHPVEEMVQKEYGRRMPWRFGSITEVSHVIDKTRIDNNKPFSWYDVKVDIYIKNFKNKVTGFDVDTLTLRFTPDVYTNGHADMDDLGDTKFKLMDYQRHSNK